MFTKFSSDISGIDLPIKFTFPFCYDPHPLSIVASEELQSKLSSNPDYHNVFGLSETKLGFGKMFGVLVVKNENNELGYLSAFSGKLDGKNDHIGFVPPVFDLLLVDGFYRKGEIVINEITIQISNLEKDDRLKSLVKELEFSKINSNVEIENSKNQIKISKENRAIIRNDLATDDTESAKRIIENLNKESINQNYNLKHLQKHWREKIELLSYSIKEFEDKIEELRKSRKRKSFELQEEIFSKYTFKNALGEDRDLNSIFNVTEDGKPPSGAGECAAPKLLHYAFQNNLKPICLAEFWWGASPLSEIRKHKMYYPSCKGKCEPILGHMLKGLELEDNPLLLNPAINKSLPIIYEDDDIILVNKPAEFLSVPGKEIYDSVYSRIKDLYPEATGPIVVHRLDMSTSGLMLLTKNKKAHDYLQYQFIKKTIKKRYVAILDGIINQKEGIIDLPLRVDLDNRPTQLVDNIHGKKARTKFEVVEIKNNRTKVYFYPITGRTHQLRVHSSHPLGLNTPILGDDLYGKKGERLYLHAQKLTFSHPSTKLEMTIECDENWN